MATLPLRHKSQVRKLYNEGGLSAREIAERFGITIDAVYYFFRRYGIPRRNPREQNIIRFHRKPLSFKLKKLSKKKESLFIAGVMLYWAEGSQWDREVNVDFANSNPIMIQLFVRFLRDICGVTERRLRCYLYCYSNQSTDQLIQYWSSLTKISRSQFTKPYIRRDYDPRKINKMPYGLIHIRYSDKRLLLKIKEWIQNVPQQLMKNKWGRPR